MDIYWISFDKPVLYIINYSQCYDLIKKYIYNYHFFMNFQIMLLTLQLALLSLVKRKVCDLSNLDGRFLVLYVWS